MDQGTARQFGDYIVRLRAEQHLSMRGLAAKAGIDSGALTRLEHGQVGAPQPDTLKALSAALGVPLSDMFVMAGYITPYDLPSIAPYLRARYGELPEDVLTAANEYFVRLLDEYGLDTTGPVAVEDESNEPSPE